MIWYSVGRLNVTTALVYAGADVNVRNDAGWTLLESWEETRNTGGGVPVDSSDRPIKNGLVDGTIRFLRSHGAKVRG